MNECGHEYKYLGVLNIFDGGKLLKVYESWKCVKCGLIRVGVRGPGVTSASEGLLPEPDSPQKRWIILLCERNKNVEVFAAKPGDEVIHRCGDEEYRLKVGDDFKLKKEGEAFREHQSLLLEDVATGFIDLSQRPPRIVKTGAGVE